jgi:MinD superfamily P-loop ATPase
MQSPIVFKEAELKKIGVVCQHCQTEAIFDLSKDHTAISDRVCPGCGKDDFLRSFVVPQHRTYNSVTYYKGAIVHEKSSTIRLYFEQN